MRQPACPICGVLVSTETLKDPFPFCSKQCKLVDFGNWADERYRSADPEPAHYPTARDVYDDPTY